MAGKKWTDSTIPQATSIGATDQFLIVQSGVSKRITQSVMQASSGNNSKTIVYTVGVAGVSGCDYNFTSVANTTLQSIQLGATTIIPVNSPIINITARCLIGLNGAITNTQDSFSSTPAGTDYINNPFGGGLDDTDEIISGGVQVAFSAEASVYFNFTPSANWNTITTGKWKIFISYIDNSIL